MMMGANNMVAACAIPPRLREPTVALWVSLRFAQQPLAPADLALMSGIDASAMFRTLDHWIDDGLVKTTSARKGAYYMTSDAKARRDPPPPPLPVPRIVRKRTVGAILWQQVRILKSFDIVEICISAETHRTTTLAYLRALTRAGLLVRTDRERWSQPSWRLVRNTGPRPPVVIGRSGPRILFDPNTGQRHDVTCPAQTALFFDGQN